MRADSERVPSCSLPSKTAFMAFKPSASMSARPLCAAKMAKHAARNVLVLAHALPSFRLACHALVFMTRFFSTMSAVNFTVALARSIAPSSGTSTPRSTSTCLFSTVVWSANVAVATR